MKAICFQVFQRRINGKTDFYRGWNEYENEFGDLNAEYWLGNISILQPFFFLENNRLANKSKIYNKI